MTYVAAFFVYFVYVGLRATQQRQVMAAQYVRMPVVSYGMAFCDVFVVGAVSIKAVNGEMLELVWLAFAIGTGGALGSILGTWLHARGTDDGNNP